MMSCKSWGIQLSAGVASFIVGAGTARTMPFPPSPVKGEAFLGGVGWGTALFVGPDVALEELWFAVLEQAL